MLASPEAALPTNASGLSLHQRSSIHPGERKRIWLVTARVGAGHVQAARAIEEALMARGLGRQIRYVDVMEHVPGWFRRAYAGGYAQMAARLPRLYGLAYRWSDRRVPGSDAMNRVRTEFDARMIRSLRAQMIKDSPDWIVHTHFLAPGPMGSWIRSSGLAARQAVVVTDFHPHQIWLSKHVNAYFVATQQSREVLVDRGVSPERVHITGIPIMAKHQRTVDCRATGAHFHWRPSGPVILVIAGSDFVIGPMDALIDRLVRELPQATIQVATGRNEALFRRLTAKSKQCSNLRVFAFTDKMNQLICCATLVVSKTGGITTSECLAHGSALVGFFPVPGQEEYNAEYLLKHEAGLKATSVDEAMHGIHRLLGDTAARVALRNNAKRLGCPHAADDISEYLLDSFVADKSPLLQCG